MNPNSYPTKDAQGIVPRSDSAQGHGAGRPDSPGPAGTRDTSRTLQLLNERRAGERRPESTDSQVWRCSQAAVLRVSA